MDFESSVLQVAVEDIIPNRFQPRLVFEDNSLQELSDSIKQHGIIQPLVLRKVGDKYEIIAGERRYKAATMAGLATVPAVISRADDKTSAEAAIVENVQRKDLTAIEEAKSYKALLDQGYMSQDQLARKMGLSQSAISNKLRLLTLPEEVQKAVMDNKISERHARSLLKIKDVDEQLNLMKRIITERLTVRQLDDIIKDTHPNGVQNINIEEVRGQAEDIKPLGIPAAIQKTTNQNSFQQGAINLGQRQQNRFFNNLEAESANMEMTEAINPFDGFQNNDSPFANTTGVDTQVNKADKIEEQKDITFSSAPEQILGGMIDVSNNTENSASENKPEIGPSDIPKIDSNAVIKPQSNPIDSFSNIFNNIKNDEEDISEPANSDNNPFKNVPPTEKVDPIDLIVEPEQESSVEENTEKATDTVETPQEDVEFLDSLDFEPPKKETNNDSAIEQINSLVDKLKSENVPINIAKNDLGDQVIIAITIKKASEN